MTFTSGLTSLPGRPLRDLATIAIAGESAAEVAEAFAAAGGPPLVLESERFALLSRSADPPAATRVRDLPANSMDLVVVRRAWRAVGEVSSALQIARDRTVPGGEVIAADLDVNRLLAGPTPLYPLRLFYLAAPMAAERLRGSTATPGLLGGEAVRARLRGVDGLTFDDIYGTHDSVPELWRSIQERGWRGAAWTPLELHGVVMEQVAAGMARAIPGGPTSHREPWYAVIGTKR